MAAASGNAEEVEEDLAAMYSSGDEGTDNEGAGGAKSRKKKKTLIPCGTCGAYNDAFSIFCIFCSRRLDRSAARAHKLIKQAIGGTRLPQNIIQGLYYHFAFQNFRIRDIITHEDDRIKFMESLGLEDDPRMRKVFDDFDRKQEESIEFLGELGGIVVVHWQLIFTRSGCHTHSKIPFGLVPPLLRCCCRSLGVVNT
eukprot:INCI9935.1.p1 GENE.INCI9935.1~~INCI9935.1.p1  ORF type:complete len:197 (+),score=31.57 INCI9935.1:101-691(+)